MKFSSIFKITKGISRNRKIIKHIIDVNKSDETSEKQKMRNIKKTIKLIEFNAKLNSNISNLI